MGDKQEDRRRFLFWPYPILSALSSRPTLFLNEPLVNTLFLKEYETQLRIRELGMELTGYEEKVKKKRREWEKRGIPENLQDWATSMAYRWAESIIGWQIRNLRKVLPEDQLEEVAKKLADTVFDQALNVVAENYLKKIAAKD